MSVWYRASVSEQRAHRALAADRGAERVGDERERLDLGRLPVALLLALVVADEAPPLTAGEDRDGEDGQDAVALESLALRLREVPDAAGDDGRRRRATAPSGRSPLSAYGRSDVIGSRSIVGSMPGGGPFEDLRRQRRAVGVAVRSGRRRRGWRRRPPRLARRTSSMQSVHDGAFRNRSAAKPDGFEDQVAARERLLGELALGDVDQDALPRGPHRVRSSTSDAWSCTQTVRPSLAMIRYSRSNGSP